MQTLSRRCGRTLVCTIALAASAVILAGSRADAYGTKAKGLAGGGVALPQDAAAIRLNPAGLVFVGNRADAGISGVTSDRSYSVAGGPSGAPGAIPLPPGTFKSNSPTVWVPNLAFSRMLNDRSSVGVATYGYGILHSDYPGGAAVSTEQLWVLPTYARKIGDSAAAGVSAVLVYHRFRAKGLGNMAPFVSDGAADNLSDNGYDTATGVGAKFGIQTELVPGLNLGASYQTKVRMGRLKQYSDLFPDRGRFDPAPVLQVGLAWAPSERSSLIFDVERTFYSEVPALSNSFEKFYHGVTTQTASELLGGSDGAGFGWRNVNVYKLGYLWQPSESWTWRAGVSYNRPPISSSEVVLNTNGANVSKWRMTAGLTRRLGERREVSASLMVSPGAKERGPNPLEAPGQQTIELRAQEWELETAYAWKF